MSTPKVSVVIPAYNASEHLRECFESILDSTFTEWECVVVNDGSTDDTAKIASLFAMRDPRFRVITTDNAGVASARNTGIEAALGEWITLVDADDCLTRCALDFMLKAADETDADIVIGQWRRNKPNDVVAPSFSREFVVKDSIGAIIETLYTHESEVGPWAKLFKANIAKAEKFTPGIRYEDIDWFYRVYEHANKITCIPDVVYFFRDNPNSFLNRFTPAHFDLLRVSERIEDHYNKRGITSLQKAARDRRLSANYATFVRMMLQTGKDEYAEEKKQCWDLICKYRTEALHNKRVSLGNKIGLLISYLGPNATANCGKIMFAI